MFGFFNPLFDLNGDGVQDMGEQMLEMLVAMEVTRDDDDDDDDLWDDDDDL